MQFGYTERGISSAPGRGRKALGSLGLLLLVVACQPPGTSPGLPPASPPPAGGASPLSTGASPAPSPAPSASPSAAATHRLTGTVVDIDRARVASALVEARQGGQTVASATTGADGAYSLLLPAGRYDITASKPGLTRRTQPVVLEAAAVLDFGPTTSGSLNPFWLADTPEIEKVDVQEAAPGGPLTLKVHLSEPLTEAARAAFDSHFEFKSSRSVDFLRVTSTQANRRVVKTSWDAAGQVYTFEYAGPYLPSGEAVQEYSILLQQDQLDSKDPVTREFELEKLGIADATGQELGRGKMRYAFKKPVIEPHGEGQLTDSVFGYLVQDRRWALTHDPLFTFKAMVDKTPPGLLSATVRVDVDNADLDGDELELVFSEPMNVAKDKDTLFWTPLDKDRNLAILNASDKEAGEDWKPLDPSLKIRVIEPDQLRPEIVRFYYPSGTFERQKRVQVTLGLDVRDPAGNKPDPARATVVATVRGGK